MKKKCDMRGFLTFIILKIISKEPMSGENIRIEIEKRKGSKPSPGTIYPVLKIMHQNKWIEEFNKKTKEKKYILTRQGKEELKRATKIFVSIFSDMKKEFD